MHKRLAIPIVVGALIGVAAGVFVARHYSDSQPDALDTANASVESATGNELNELQSRLQNTLVLPEDFRTVPDFSLLAKDGSVVDQTVLDNRWTVAFFGYTYCPDVCPITLQVMKEVVNSLEADENDPMQVAFFTVDPKRDTVERMNEYVSFFDPSFHGITGELTDVLNLTRELGIVASFTANDQDPENYLVDHTASMLLIDPQRRVRAKFRPPHEAASIIADYRAILASLN